jgi:CheY-specific phosphatase CheX
MNTLTPDRLAELTVVALERTAFMMADPIAVDAVAMAATSRNATIRYSGPGSGALTLRTTDGFLRGLASSLLGVEPEAIELESCGQDAIKELTNIVGGSVVMELGGSDCTYSLGLPELLAPTPAAPRAASARSCCLDCEGQLLFVIWTPDAMAA